MFESSANATISSVIAEHTYPIITPQTIRKAVRDAISISKEIAREELRFEKDPESMSQTELKKLLDKVEKQMRKAAAELDFESAAEYRDKLKELRASLESFKI